jgi:hypothetical protein
MSGRVRQSGVGMAGPALGRAGPTMGSRPVAKIENRNVFHFPNLF